MQELGIEFSSEAELNGAFAQFKELADVDIHRDGSRPLRRLRRADECVLLYLDHRVHEREVARALRDAG